MTRTTWGTMRGLAVLWILFSGPAQAQTAMRCSTAADVLSASQHGIEDLRLRETYADIFAVNEIVWRTVGLAYVGVADTVQVFSLGTGGYLLMASVQGCHVAHDFVDETFVLGLKRLYPDLSRRARSPSVIASL